MVQGRGVPVLRRPGFWEGGLCLGGGAHPGFQELGPSLRGLHQHPPASPWAPHPQASSTCNGKENYGGV